MKDGCHLHTRRRETFKSYKSVMALYSTSLQYLTVRLYYNICCQMTVSDHSYFPGRLPLKLHISFAFRGFYGRNARVAVCRGELFGVFCAALFSLYPV
jgi:hypothetical protein